MFVGLLFLFVYFCNFNLVITCDLTLFINNLKKLRLIENTVNKCTNICGLLWLCGLVGSVTSLNCNNLYYIVLPLNKSIFSWSRTSYRARFPTPVPLKLAWYTCPYIRQSPFCSLFWQAMMHILSNGSSDQCKFHLGV